MLASNIIAYKTFLKDSKEPVQIRLAMVKRYKETGSITQVAREFQTTRKTVKKWVDRFDGTISSLKNHSRAPKQPFRQIKERTEKLLVEFKQKYKKLGYAYIHNYLIEAKCDEIPSKKTVYGIWRKHKLLSKYLTKREKKKNLQEIKAKYKAFEKIQIDVKELRDIPNILEQSINLGLKKQKELPNKYGLPMYRPSRRRQPRNKVRTIHSKRYKNRSFVCIFSI